NQGTGATSYYVGCAYRCTGWSSNFPSCLLFQAPNTGADVKLLQLAASTGAVVETLFDSGTTGLTFTTTDVLKFRVVSTGTMHAASYSKNGGPWTVLYSIVDPSGT